ncbi:MAG: hypothetical protein MZV64_11800 [Ignavibacteriales bacterium]|nr:hypothetical protein [Ignavibacteriales bacterium]
MARARPRRPGPSSATRPFWESMGRASNSPSRPMTGLPGAVGGDEAGRHAGQAPLDREAGGFERVGQELRRVELLEAELGVLPDGVRDAAELLDRLGLAEPVEDGLLLLGDLALGLGRARRPPARGRGSGPAGR